MYSSEAPMVGLLMAQARRRGFHRLPVWTVLSVALFLLPSAAGALMGSADSLGLRSFVITFGLAIGVLLPLAQLYGDAALLSSLRRGHCLEEIVGTRTPSHEVVDQVASFSVVSVLKMGGAVVLPVVAGLLIVAPAAYRSTVLLGSLAWFPVAAALVLVGSYTMQAACVWSRKGNAGVAAGFFSLVLPAAVYAWTQEGYVALFGAATLLVGLGVLARGLAIGGLDRAGEPREVAPLQSGRRSPGWSLLKDNPIALREARRQGGSLGFPGQERFGLAGYFLARHWPLLLGTGFLVAVALTLGGDAMGVTMGVVGVFVFVQPLFASGQTARSILSEREGGTLEALATTGIDARQFVDGWAVAAWGPRLVETFLVLVVAAALLAWDSGADVLMPLLYVPDTLARIFMGAYLGLVVSCMAKTRRDMWWQLLLLWFAVSMTLSMVSGILGLALTFVAGIGSGQVLALVGFMAMGMTTTLAAAVGFRWLAISQVRLLLGPRRQ